MLAAIAGAGTAFGGCLGVGGGGVPSTTSLTIDEDGFHPKNTSIATEQSVHWENTGDETHEIASASDNWSFGPTAVEPGQIVRSQKFFEAGVYEVADESSDGTRMKIAVGDAEIEELVE